MEFQWDEDNVAHIDRHKVDHDEVEELAFDDEPCISKGRGETRYMLGYAISGRYLFIVYILKGKSIARVVTAMDMDKKTRRLYRKRGHANEVAQIWDRSRRKRVLGKAFHR